MMRWGRPQLPSSNWWWGVGWWGNLYSTGDEPVTKPAGPQAKPMMSTWTANKYIQTLRASALNMLMFRGPFAEWLNSTWRIEYVNSTCWKIAGAHANQYHRKLKWPWWMRWGQEEQPCNWTLSRETVWSNKNMSEYIRSRIFHKV